MVWLAAKAEPLCQVGTVLSAISHRIASASRRRGLMAHCSVGVFAAFAMMLCSGPALARGPGVTLSPSSLAFGFQVIKTTSAPQVITLTNTGPGTLNISSITISGKNRVNFAQTNNCGLTVAKGASCQITVTFTPVILGAVSASVTVRDDGLDNPQQARLSGTGTSVQLVPSSLAFGFQVVDTASAPESVTLTNEMKSALIISSIAIGGINSGDFTETSNCGGQVNGHAHCDISVTFQPAALGARSATLTITDNGGGGSQNVPLSGTGISPGPYVTLSPASLTFGKQRVGTSSAPQVVTLTNVGSATLNITTLAITGTNNADYSQSNTCGSSVNAGASCAITVVFTPTAMGTRTADVTITDNAPGSPQSVSLTGISPFPVPSINQPLTPDAASPGGAGFTLTVNGTGFTSSSIVHWDGGARATTFVRATRLTAAILAADISVAATASVTVSNPLPGGGISSPVLFQVTSLATPVSMNEASLTTGLGPRSIVWGDFNGDGKPDLAVANRDSNSVSIFLGNGDGTFQAGVSSATGEDPIALAAGDFNGDGKLDLVLADRASYTISILLGNGDGTFSAHVDLPAGVEPLWVTVGDFNSDGALDVAAANSADGTISIFLGNGDGTFQPQVQYVASSSPFAVVAADFNSDGIPDLAVTDSGANTVSVLLGNGDGTFQSPVPYATGNTPLGLLAADFNGDGKLDLAVVSSEGNTVSVLLNLGNGTFAPHADYPAGLQPFAVAAGDFNGDGKIDLAVSNSSSNSVSILPGNGDGTFQSGAQYASNPGPEGITAADFNGDGRLDLATANEASDNASVLLQIPAVSLVPSNLAFGSQMLGSQTSQAIAFTNTGGAALSIAGITIMGADSADYSETNNCGNSLAGGASCTVTVTFTPATIGDLTAAVVFTDSAGNSPQTVGLDGVGADPSVTLLPASLTFSSEPIGTASPPQTVSLTNSGNATLNITAIAITGVNSGDFAETSACGTVPAGASCSIMVTFTPTATGTRVAAVTITDNAPGSSQSVSLSGTGIPPPVVNLAPPNLTFGDQAVDTTSPPQTVTLTNTGMGALTISRFDIQGDYLQTNNCGTTVQPNASCAITVTFTPTATGDRSGQVFITDDAMGSPQTFSTAGKGTAAPLTFSPTHYNFTNQPIGSPSPKETITLTNSTSAGLEITSLTITGPDSGDYSQTNNCGSTLNVGASCNIKVTFTPQALGPRVASITLVDNAKGSPQTVPLIGNGTLPGVGLVPPSLTFADQIVGANSSPSTITLTNTGDAKLIFTSLTITGTNAADFSQTNNCGQTLAYGHNCSISVIFNPTATGMRAAAISITDNAPGSPQMASLSGTGVAPSVVLSPVSLTFSAQQVGTSSAPQTVILSNVGSAALTVNELSLSGINAADYSQNNNCVGSVAPGANCAINVTFSPSASGTRSATLSISDNASGSPQMLGLMGTATAPVVTLFPASLMFAGQPVDTTSPPQMMNVNNTGTAPLTVSGVTISGVNGGDYSQTNDCNAQIAIGASCLVVVTFTPRASGTRTANISITDNAAGSPQSAPLSGTGTGTGPPTASLSTTTLTFAAQNVNTTSAAQPVMLTNTGGSPLNIVSIVAAGDYAQTNNCGASLAMGASCSVQVTFTPSAAGSRTGYVTFSDDDPTNLQTVTLSGAGTTPTSTVSITPRQASMTPGRTQQFQAYISGVQSNQVTWAVDGIAGGNSGTGTISAAGLYTAPSAPGSHVVTATSIANMTQSASVPVIVTNYAGTFTYHNDLARTGQNENETVLTTGNVNQSQFGKLFSYPVDGDVYAQPLYVPGVNISGQGVYNVVYVATENDSLYALDADGTSSSPLWQVSFINPSQGITPVGTADIGCTNITPVIGITGTPVIDLGANAIYLVVRTKEVSGNVTSYVQRLHALDLGTHQELPGSPVVITASVPGTGDGGSQVNFDPLHSNQRAGLLLLNGTIYIAWGSHCDVTPYHGWILGYDESNLQQSSAYCVTANGAQGGIWQSGGAPAVDADGNIFVETGNGTFDANTGGVDYGESYLKLIPGTDSLTPGDYFTPSDWSNLNDADLDVGSGGPVILPDQPGQIPHLLVGAGKDGEVFLLDRDQMGEFNPYGNQVVQALPPNTVPTFHSMPAYWESNVYFVGVGGFLKSFRLTDGYLSTLPVSESPGSFSYPGAVPTSSSNSAVNGIVWLLETANYSRGGPDVLHAFDAANVSRELYNTNQNSVRDKAGVAVKFGVPTVANGKVYVGTNTELDVYGLLP
jgi:hypothetical protein